jgi:hypothetical protein
MTERATSERLMQDPRYVGLVTSTYVEKKDFLKDGLRVLESPFFPRKRLGPNYKIWFDPEMLELSLSIENLRGTRVSTMVYHIKEGQAVTKTGFAEGQGVKDHELTYYTSDPEKESGKRDNITFVEPPLSVGLPELEIIAKLVENPHLNAELVYELPQFQI